MIDKIGNLAERLATNVSQSRRGFLARLGQAALGAAGALGGLLALPGAAQAAPRRHGYCQVAADVGSQGWLTGWCVSYRDCARAFTYTQCGGRGTLNARVCGFWVDRRRCYF
jgi:hypothetical protein